jgi:hypothetical protein
MLANDLIEVWNKAPGTKINGVYVPGVLSLVKSIFIDIQPYSKSLLLKAYGYDIEVNKRCYVDYFDKDIRIGTILKYTDKYDKLISLEVKAIPWDDGYMEVMCLGI